MTPQAIVFLSSAWGVIIVCVGYCFYRLLTSDRKLG